MIIKYLDTNYSCKKINYHNEFLCWISIIKKKPLQILGITSTFSTELCVLKIFLWVVQTELIPDFEAVAAVFNKNYQNQTEAC